MAWIYNRRSVGHTSCYSPTQIDKVTEGSSSTEMARVCSIHAVLHAAVFQIIDIPIQGKGKHLSHYSCA